MKNGTKLVAPGVLALGFLVAGCVEDAATTVKKQLAADTKAGQKRAAEALPDLEQQAKDGNNFSLVMHQVGKLKALAWGDAELEKRLDACAETVRKARDAQAQAIFAAAEKVSKDALGETDPDASIKSCAAAIAALDKLPPGVEVALAKEIDVLRRQLVERILVANRAKEILTRAKELQDAELSTQARAALGAFKLVDEWKTSPFATQLETARGAIPEAQATSFLTIVDGMDEDQLLYFKTSPPTLWWAPDAQDPFIVGDNDPDDNDDDATAWLGDESWGDYSMQLLFKIIQPGDRNLGFKLRLRCQIDTSIVTTLPDDVDYDKIVFSCDKVGKGTWVQYRIDVKGDEAVATNVMTGEKERISLRFKKGRLGLSVPRGGIVGIRELKLRLGEGCKPPEIHKEKKPDVFVKPRHKRKPKGGEAPAPPEGEK